MTYASGCLLLLRNALAPFATKCSVLHCCRASLQRASHCSAAHCIVAAACYEQTNAQTYNQTNE
eukprot:11209281-Lingulodinium_polyedra.AAC.1